MFPLRHTKIEHSQLSFEPLFAFAQRQDFCTRSSQSLVGVRKKKMCSLTNADLVIVNPRDVILKITSAAICGSDCIFYSGLMPTMEKGDVLS
jgi:hypothetical protein